MEAFGSVGSWSAVANATSSNCSISGNDDPHSANQLLDENTSGV